MIFYEVRFRNSVYVKDSLEEAEDMALQIVRKSLLWKVEVWSFDTETEIYQLAKILGPEQAKL